MQKTSLLTSWKHAGDVLGCKINDQTNAVANAESFLGVTKVKIHCYEFIGLFHIKILA